MIWFMIMKHVKIAKTLQSGSSFVTDATHFSVDNNEFVGRKGFYEIYFFDSYQSTSSNTSLWFHKTMISDGSTENIKVADTGNTRNAWHPLSMLFGQSLTPSTDQHTFFIKNAKLDGQSYGYMIRKTLSP